MRIAIALSLGTLLVAVGFPASAQVREPERRRVEIRIVPRVGLLAPDTYLYEQFANFAGDGPVEWTDGQLRRALVLGVGVEMGRPDGVVSVRAELLRSFGGGLTLSHSVVIPRQLYDAPYVQTTWLNASASVTMGSLQFVLPTRITVGRAQPYVLVGGAAKRYGFGEPATTDSVTAILPSSGVTWGGDVGAGVVVPAHGFLLDLQGRDVINRYWGRTQHDLVFTAGLVRRVH